MTRPRGGTRSPREGELSKKLNDVQFFTKSLAGFQKKCYLCIYFRLQPSPCPLSTSIPAVEASPRPPRNPTSLSISAQSLHTIVQEGTSHPATTLPHKPHFEAPHRPASHSSFHPSSPASAFLGNSAEAHTPKPMAWGKGGIGPLRKAGKGENTPLYIGSVPTHAVPKPTGFATFLLPQSPVSALRKALFGTFFGRKGYTLSAYTLYPFAQNTTTPFFSTCPFVRGQKGLRRALSRPCRLAVSGFGRVQREVKQVLRSAAPAVPLRPPPSGGIPRGSDESHRPKNSDGTFAFFCVPLQIGKPQASQVEKRQKH